MFSNGLTTSATSDARPGVFLHAGEELRRVIVTECHEYPDITMAESEGFRTQANGSATASRPMNDDWRAWIAENLMLDTNPVLIVDTLVRSNFAREDATREVELAAKSPYVRGAYRLKNRLKKRDWLLATYRKLNRLRPESGQVDRRDRLSRKEFFEEYYVLNRPVIITGMINDWPALTKWNLAYFADRFGDQVVEVQYGRGSDANYEIDRNKFARKMPFHEYVHLVGSAGKTNAFYLTANNNAANKTALAQLWNDIVQIPEYLDGRDPLAGFFWFGPEGTITPYHHDLTNNLLAQVIGRKRCLLVPSWDIPMMGNQKHVYSTIDGRNTLPSPFPSDDAAQVVECEINPGEIIFLPIGGWHFVEALDIAVSVSFTNFVFDNDFHTFYKTYDAV